MQPVTIRLIRHGQTDLNRMNKYVSRSDPSLNEFGREQIFDFLERNKDITFSGIYTSPLKRCQESSEIIAKCLGIETYIDDRLREIDLGNFEGLSPSELLSHNSPFRDEYELWRNNDIVEFPQSGECVDHAIGRVSDFWNSIIDSGNNIIVCSHSILSRILLCNSVLNLPYRSYRKFSIDNGKFFDFEVNDGYVKISKLNS